jgi:hypothetical protein
LLGVQEVPGSNPGGPTNNPSDFTTAYSFMVASVQTNANIPVRDGRSYHVNEGDLERLPRGGYTDFAATIYSELRCGLFQRR